MEVPQRMHDSVSVAPCNTVLLGMGGVALTGRGYAAGRTALVSR